MNNNLNIFKKVPGITKKKVRPDYTNITKNIFTPPLNILRRGHHGPNHQIDSRSNHHSDGTRELKVLVWRTSASKEMEYDTHSKRDWKQMKRHIIMASAPMVDYPPTPIISPSPPPEPTQAPPNFTAQLDLVHRKMRNELAINPVLNRGQWARKGPGAR